MGSSVLERSAGPRRKRGAGNAAWTLVALRRGTCETLSSPISFEFGRAAPHPDMRRRFESQIYGW
jgi:hypothetical protein